MLQKGCTAGGGGLGSQSLSPRSEAVDCNITKKNTEMRLLRIHIYTFIVNTTTKFPQQTAVVSELKSQVHTIEYRSAVDST